MSSPPKCPVTGSYEFIPSQKEQGDSRSVCPALNAMANHGYIPRSGKDLSVLTIARGLVKCYNLTFPFALFLTVGGFLSISRFTFRPVSLFDFGKHNRVEHDASLVHRDVTEGEQYGTSEIVTKWAEELIGDIEPTVTADAQDARRDMDILVNEADIGRARVRREKMSKPLDSLHAEVARGEMAIILGVWERKPAGKKSGIPLPWLFTWLTEERMPSPEEWTANQKRKVGLFEVVGRSKKIRATADATRAAEDKKAT